MQSISLADACVSVLDCEHKTPAARATGHPYIAIPDIRDGRVELKATRRISDCDLAEWTRRTEPRLGDVLVTRRGRVGDTAPITDVPCAIGQNLVLLRSSGSQVDQRYLRWATRGPLWQSEVDRLINVGAVFSSLNVRDIAKMRIPVHPLPEQQAIAEVLGALDDKIAANRALVDTATKLAQSITARRLRGGNPRALSTLGRVTMGSSPRGESYNQSQQGLALYQGTRDFGIRFPSPRIWTTEPVREAQRGDILLSVRAPVGSLNFAAQQCCIGRGLAAITTDHPHALFHLLNRQPELLSAFNSDGTIFGSITKAQLGRLPVVVPSAGIGALESELAPVELAVESALAEIATLADLRDTLLPALMDGTLRVKDAERPVNDTL